VIKDVLGMTLISDVKFFKYKQTYWTSWLNFFRELFNKDTSEIIFIFKSGLILTHPRLELVKDIEKLDNKDFNFLFILEFNNTNFISNLLLPRECVFIKSNDVVAFFHKINCSCISTLSTIPKSKILFFKKNGSGATRKKFDFNIDLLAPPLSNRSAGAVGIYRLINKIQDSGIGVKLVDYGYNNISQPHLVQNLALSSTKEKNKIVLTTDTVSGLPTDYDYEFKWLLNRPGFLKTSQLGQFSAPEQLKIAYSSIISRDITRLFINVIDHDFWEPSNRFKRDKIVLYTGKFGSHPGIRNLVFQLIRKFNVNEVITRNHPSSKNQLKELLVSTDILLSLDPLSSLNYEASLCGARVVVLFDLEKKWQFSDLLLFDLPIYGTYSDLNEVESFEFNKVLDFYNESKSKAKDLEVGDSTKFIETLINLNKRI
jgi:hypothetical protein